uniref:RING-type domain-containing protein n=1 Tax=Lactuca sativa TaxID=4236 RepID=A0A9R1W3Y2_LACSA|nr:hypothetical protein LSAT_V11C300139720 [Lactuca sativa]
MGGKNSREKRARCEHSSSFSGNQYSGYLSQPYFALPPPATAPPASPPRPHKKKKLDKRYSKIDDSYTSLEQVTEALTLAGLESSNLIVGIDFTKSNEWTGSKSFYGKSLHHTADHSLNPYEHAISIIGKTLAAFDEDNLIPCYGFGDATTHDQDVFSFYPEDGFCNGFEDVLSRYREIIPHLKLSGPTSFAPVIEQAMTIVEQSGGQYHVLLIIADGQVTRSVDTESGQLSLQEQKTVDAIVKASKLPLSIVLVGVGDGPWDMMKEFDDNIPDRDFDNFQLLYAKHSVSYTVFDKTRAFGMYSTENELRFMSTGQNSKVVISRIGMSSWRAALPLPIPQASSSSYNTSKALELVPFSRVYGQTSQLLISESISRSTNHKNVSFYTIIIIMKRKAISSYYYLILILIMQLCPICLTNTNDMALGCGHQTCHECGETLQLCPICRNLIETRIKLH